MDQNLDLQIAALIFLGGTQNLVSGSDHGGVETTSDDEEVEAEPGNTIKHNLQIPALLTSTTCISSLVIANAVQEL